MFRGTIVWKGIVYSLLMVLGKGLVSSVIYLNYFMESWRDKRSASRRREKNAPPQEPNIQRSGPQDQEARAKCPHVIALMVSFAMISRGEIGFLIASLSQSSGTLTLRHRDRPGMEPSGEDIFLVITWAVVICTIAGPLGVGFFVHRLRLVTEQSLSKWL